MTDYQTRAEQLEGRIVDFGVAVIKKCRKYSRDPVFAPIINQLIRSSTSIGANYAEANNASSKTDFRNKIYIAKKEAGETQYWLRLLPQLLPDEDFSQLQQEALELTLILQKIVSTMKKQMVNEQ